ncbi:acetyl-CoA carboxylase biotin carboxylase subunit [Peredibacter starrii]|uniref:Biotin carboxylase N-terminal domain-containing protein n=1 Tax=Peredibacter starrii TaxID=28202 RepID=A0AAX4HTG7_9BACT|nr:biotin carboxylase N-terminal domain-containing protein [Peredibacter starrii]WPU66363.1 biotin carboxylase N-terminal domain-containing protein [Peredibacter starrii]
MKIKKILVANRGEIALRVLKTAKEMGIKVVTVYAEDDKNLPHALYADESYSLGTGALADTYLNKTKLIEITKKSGADAIHPGYGFLSENEEFARMVEGAGITFIGPTPESIVLMGDKIGSKKALEKIKVPLTPGYHGDDQNDDNLVKEAKKIGFPVLIKASAGGGGKGMRIVHEESELLEGIRGAKSEGLKSFGSDKVLIEKYVLNPRHIEVQLMSDTHGNHLHFFERECSIQRRYQKVIEETPAPNMSQELRLKVCETAVEIARGINYRGAGTVEFIMAQDGSFYFMEMNTRLQVEHPVTEMVTGHDLVKYQIMVAQGDKLPLKQSDIKQKGSSIECRIYAEDPDNNFMPSIGKIERIGIPTLRDVRLDCGFLDGTEVGVNYDPMLAKLVVWGETRETAISKTIHSLDEVLFLGVKTNRDYLKRLLAHKDFVAGNTHTHFIPDHKAELEPVAMSDADLANIIGALSFTGKTKVATGGMVESNRTPWTELTGFRN